MIVIFAPNGGVNLGSGGGTRFTFLLANLLRKITDEPVKLVAYNAYDFRKMMTYHGEADPNIVCDNNDDLGMKSFKLSAYDGLLLRSAKRFLSESLDKLKPDTIFFQDDIPVFAEEYLQKYAPKTTLYVHYPLLARDIIPKSETSRIERLNDKLLKMARKYVIVQNAEKYCKRIFSNSLVTQVAMRVIGVQSDILYPYVLEDLNTYKFEKERTICCIGTINKTKRQLDVIKAFEKSKLYDIWNLICVGNVRDKYYASEIKRASGQRNYISQNNSFEYVNSVMKSSVAIVQAGVFEPFGISLFEGIARHCKPIVRSSILNGGWMDFLMEKDEEAGFVSIEDLVEIFNKLKVEEYNNKWLWDQQSLTQTNFIKEISQVI